MESQSPTKAIEVLKISIVSVQDSALMNESAMTDRFWLWPLDKLPNLKLAEFKNQVQVNDDPNGIWYDFILNWENLRYRMLV